MSIYNRETEGGWGGGGVILKFVELSCGMGFLLTCEKRTPLARLRILLKNIFLPSSVKNERRNRQNDRKMHRTKQTLAC